MDLMEIGCEDGRWMELAQDRVQWRASALAVLNFRVLLPQLLILLFLLILFSQVFPGPFPLEPVVNPTTQASSL
jgi:hypothetical protein